MQPPGRRIRPKVPQRTQRRGQQGEKENGAAGQAQQDIQPRDALHPAEQKEDHRQQGGNAVDAVRQPGEARMAPPQRAEQIVEQGDHPPDQNRLPEGQQLDRDVVFHISRTAGAAG